MSLSPSSLKWRKAVRRFSLSVLMVCGVFPMRGSLSAAPLIDFDFENGSTVGWATNTHEGASDSYLAVVEDPLRSGNLVMKVDDTFKTLNGIVTAFPEQHSGVFRLSFEIMVATTGGGASSPGYFLDRRVALTDGGVSKIATYNRLWYYGDGEGQFRSYGYNGGAGERGPDPVLDQWYEVTQVFDLAAGTWSWTLKNLTTDTDVWSSGELQFFHEASSLARLTFWRVDSRGGLFYLDNVKLEAIPEPSGIMLLGAAGGAWLAIRRRRYHHLGA